MKKITAVLCVLLLGTTFVVAAPAKTAGKIKNSKIVEAQNASSFTYEGVHFFVPKRQTLLLGKRANGSIVIRGYNIENVKIEESTIAAKGYAVLTYQPSTRVIFLNRGDSLTVMDPTGTYSTVGEKGAISTTNAAINSDTVAEMKAAAEREAVAAAQELPDVPGFVEEREATSAAVEQAVQDIEETLSPSAPR